MTRHCVTLIASALILWVAGSSDADAAGVRPGYYAHTQLVFGNAAERYAAGCLRWQFQQKSWYDYCVGGRSRVISVRY